MSIVIEAPATKRYRLGIHPRGAPAHFLTLGGKCFPQYSGEYDENGRQNAEPWNVVDLTSEDLSRIDVAINEHFVRWRRNSKGEKTSAMVIQAGNKLYPRQVGDEDLRPHVFIREEPLDVATRPFSLPTLG